MSQDPEAWLDVDSATVAYGGTVALDGVSVGVAEGETLAVVGPSGSGKTTLLRAVAGLEPLRSGRITAGGVALDGLPVHRRDLGLMFQDHALFPQLDVAGNIAFGLRMKGWSALRRRDRVSDLLSMMGLEGYGTRPVHELSGGEAQRVALARALAPEPRLLMLDEPFGSLDRVLREQLTGEVRRLLTDLGQTALHVTHDQDEAFAIADQLAVLRSGRVQQAGSPEDLWHRPASAFVAEFVGHPNRWTMSVQHGVLHLGSVGLGRWEGAGHVHGASAGGDGGGGFEVVVPVQAILVDDDGPLPVRVERVGFREGRFRIEAVTESSARAVPIVFEHKTRLQAGARVRVRIDPTGVYRL